MGEVHTGRCLCGAVSFTLSGPLTPPVACHCSQCRRQSGHVWAASEVRRDALAVTGQDRLSWYRATPGIRRGFCATCGSFLFWDREGGDTIDIAMGAIDPPTGQMLSHHIFVADKGDYYAITDGLPQHAQ